MDFNEHYTVEGKKEIEQKLIEIKEAVLGEIKKLRSYFRS